MFYSFSQKYPNQNQEQNPQATVTEWQYVTWK